MYLNQRRLSSLQLRLFLGNFATAIGQCSFHGLHIAVLEIQTRFIAFIRFTFLFIRFMLDFTGFIFGFIFEYTTDVFTPLAAGN